MLKSHKIWSRHSESTRDERERGLQIIDKSTFKDLQHSIFNSNVAKFIFLQKTPH